MGARLLTVCVALSLVAGLACSNGSKKNGPEPGPVDPRGTVTGLVLDEVGAPMAGAVVAEVGGAVSARSDADGRFTLRLDPGARRLVALVRGKILCERCVVVAEATLHDLGEMAAGAPNGCLATAPAPGDADGDGLLDADEQAGWLVSVGKADGTYDVRLVTSDPGVADTDGDGLTDAEERAAGTDPRRKDTDGDMLSDHAELYVYRSNPTLVDSDGDSRGPRGDREPDPALFDGWEILLSGTSPTLDDTDGDGMTDWEEIHSGGTSPLVADLPSLALQLSGDPLIAPPAQVNTTCKTGDVRLSREETEDVKTDTSSTKMSIENTVKLHTETEAGTSQWPPSFSAKLTTDTEFKHGYFQESSSSWKKTSMQSAQKTSECWETQEGSLSPGIIRAMMRLRNQSNLSFKVMDLRVVAHQLRGGGTFGAVGTFEPQGLDPAGQVLGPGGEMTFEVARVDVEAQTMLALTKNPSALVFQVAGYELFQLDEMGRTETANYAKLSERVAQRTANIVIDPGNGEVERYQLATNVFRRPDGTARGLSMKEALDRLGVPFASARPVDSTGANVGKKVLTRVRRVSATAADAPGRGFWLVGGTSHAFDVPGEVDFDDLPVQAGDRIQLVYLLDSDRDGLFDREERLLGTDPYNPDTDGDGLTDYQETKEGWIVAVGGASRPVYSDPLAADRDGDYLSDASEKALGSDPYRKDTDGDGTLDTNDPDPLHPPCLEGTALGLSAWWNGQHSTAGATVYDLFTGVSIGDSATAPVNRSSNGTASAPATMFINPSGSNPMLSFNPGPTQADEYVSTPDDLSLSPVRELTISAIVIRSDRASPPPWATIVAKGAPATASYGLYLAPDGRVRLTIYRSRHDQCWYCSFGSNSLCVDWSCADSDALVAEELTTDASHTVPANVATHVAATFGGDVMRIYIDGAQAAWKETAFWGWSGWYRHYYSTNYLVDNASPLRIGVPEVEAWPYSGILDDVRFFKRQLAAGDLGLLQAIGTCHCTATYVCDTTTPPVLP